MPLLSWGSNKFGETGTETFNQSVLHPTIILKDVSIAPVSIATGEGHSLIVNKTGELYACGRGREGQLGLGHKKDINTPVLVHSLKDEIIVSVAAGNMSSYAITSSGQVYQWGLIHENNTISAAQGSNQDLNSVTAGQLTGMSADQSKSIAPDLEERARQSTSQAVANGKISASNNNHEYNKLDAAATSGTAAAAAAVKSAGPPCNPNVLIHERHQGRRELREIVEKSTEMWLMDNDGADDIYYAELEFMGYNKEEKDLKMTEREKEYHGIMTLQCRRYFQDVPLLIPNVSQIVSVSAGYAHCMLLTATGQLLAAGYNDRGQLGLGHRISTSQFKKVDYLERKFVTKVVCGAQHTMCIATAFPHDVNAVYVWGNGMLGQLGLGRKGTGKGRLLPCLMEPFSDNRVVDISCGANFSVAVTDAGEVYSWGHAEYNQHGGAHKQGVDYTDPFHYFTPQRMPTLEGMQDDGGEKIVQVDCGANYTVAVSDRGEVYSWGWNAYGVLGHGMGSVLSPPSRIASLGPCASLPHRSGLLISAGANHVVLATHSDGSDWAVKLFRNAWRGELNYSDMTVVLPDSGHRIAVHKAILCARSKYCASYVKEAEKENEGNTPIIDLELYSNDANIENLESVLEFIYTDRVELLHSFSLKRRNSLSQLAEFFCLSQLADQCSRKERMSQKMKSSFATLEVEEPTYHSSADSFECNMLHLLESADLYSDIVFVFGDPSQVDCVEYLFSHKIILSQSQYFAAFFAGHFKENFISFHSRDFTAIFIDQIDFDIYSLQCILRYMYTGKFVFDCCSIEEVMQIAVGASIIGLIELQQLSEKFISLHLQDYEGNVENCLHFAILHNLPRLVAQCQSLLGCDIISCV